MRFLPRTARVKRRVLVVVLFATACGQVWVAHAESAVTPAPASGAAAAPSAEAQSGRVCLPQLVKKPAPEFPAQAIRGGFFHGLVYLQVLVDVRGHTANPVMLEAKPAGVGFEAAALAVVGKYRYAPALQDGEPVAAYVIVPVVFERVGLNGRGHR